MGELKELEWSYLFSLRRLIATDSNTIIKQKPKVYKCNEVSSFGFLDPPIARLHEG